ncbi:MAG: nickel pincer cofactor biosynthesis protein LarB [Planctomycetota bacterium JB042]
MNHDSLKELLDAVAAGRVAPDEAARRLAAPPIGDLGFARLDHHRELRCGFPEVVLCEGKRPDDAAAIAAELASRADRVLLTRADEACWEAVRTTCPTAVRHERARAITIERDGAERPPGKGLVAVVTAGTADIPVAEEARVTAELMGARVEARFDVGVAALHRILAEGELLRAARVLVVCAGMEGALPSVVGGLVARPVIAVPTSVGYGASFGGLAAFLGMLNSCASNVATVNIDNGFGAGYLAALINSDPDPDRETS